MSLLPPSVIDALAGKIARAIGPTLQSTLAQFTQPTRGRASAIPAMMRIAKPDQSGEGILSKLAGMIDGRQSDQGGRSRSSGSSPARSALPPAVTAKAVAMAQKQVAIAQQQSGPAWWRRGWGTLQNGKKRATSQRAARLTILASKRLQSAKRAVRASNASRNTPGWHPAAHGALLAIKNAATQKLSQATILQSKTTLAGALASGRVAAGLMSLAGKIPALAGPIGIAATVGMEIAKLPFRLSRWNTEQIESQRSKAQYSGVMATAFAKYDTKTSNLNTISARDTASTTAYLVDRQNKLRTTLQPIRDFGTNVKNFALGIATGEMTTLMRDLQAGADLAQATGKAAGKNFGFINPLDVMDEMQKITKAREDKAAADAKLQGQQFSQTAQGWALSVIPDQGLADARWNNVSKPPLRPMR